ncbi:hypothetical protein [Streptomyces sp. NPDC048106]|uniref:hypothetical protein n=1 Tax=Streptomyces sp. NPDC048106 TaxID=3155750 RepID=UPI003456D9DF
MKHRVARMVALAGFAVIFTLGAIGAGKAPASTEFVHGRHQVQLSSTNGEIEWP